MSTFKKEYSAYRLKIANACVFGSNEDYKTALKSNTLFFYINFKEEVHTSKKIFLYKNYRDIYDTYYREKVKARAYALASN